MCELSHFSIFWSFIIEQNDQSNAYWKNKVVEAIEWETMKTGDYGSKEKRFNNFSTQFWKHNSYDIIGAISQYLKQA